MYCRQIGTLGLLSGMAFALACSNLPRYAPPPGHFLAVYHSSGGPAPVVETLYVYDDGRLVLNPGDRAAYWKSNLTPFESRRLREALDSQAMEEIRAAAKAIGYEEGCCDQEDVAVEYHGLVLAFPCGEAETPAALRDLGKLLNDIASSHFEIRSFIPAGCFEGPPG